MSIETLTNDPVIEKFQNHLKDSRARKATKQSNYHVSNVLPTYAGIRNYLASKKDALIKGAVYTAGVIGIVALLGGGIATVVQESQKQQEQQKTYQQTEHVASYLNLK